MTVRAKFTVAVVTAHASTSGKTIKLQAIYETSIPEDRRFYDATPTGSLEMFVNNPVAIERLARGKSFYVDFTPIPVDTPS